MKLKGGKHKPKEIFSCLGALENIKWWLQYNNISHVLVVIAHGEWPTNQVLAMMPHHRVKPWKPSYQSIWVMVTYGISAPIGQEFEGKSQMFIEEKYIILIKKKTPYIVFGNMENWGKKWRGGKHKPKETFPCLSARRKITRERGKWRQNFPHDPPIRE